MTNLHDSAKSPTSDQVQLGSVLQTYDVGITYERDRLVELRLRSSQYVYLDCYKTSLHYDFDIVDLFIKTLFCDYH